MNRLKDTYKHMAAVASALLLALSVLPACSDNKGEEVLPQEEETLYTVTLSLNPSSRGATTKANDPYWDTDDNEKLEKYERYIDNCVVAIFQDGKWVQSLSTGVSVSGGTSDDITIDNDNPPHEDYSTKVGTAIIELPAGTYTFYAFANLTSLNIDEGTAGTALINELVTGKTSDNSALTEEALKAKAVSLGDDPNRFNPDDDIYIPMSSYGETTVLDSDASLGITLFRMLGKVTVEINNQTSSDLTLKSLEMGNFRRGNIFLVPYGSGNTSLDNLTQNDEDSFNPDLPDDMNAKTESRTLTIEEDQQKIAKDMKASFTFYEFETDVESQTKEGFGGSMWLATNIGRNNKPQELVDFSFMRRNDWLNIPVQILETDLETTIIGSRMPIGGTPKTITYPAEDAFIPILYHTIDYPGKITISFTFSLEESDGFGDVNFEFAPPQHEAGIQYTEAQLVENNNGLLYDEEKQAALDVPSKIAITETSNEGASATATMTLTTQELAYEGTAQIDLMLAVSYTKNDTSGRITVPYTIKLTNGKTEKGGN